MQLSINIGSLKQTEQIADGYTDQTFPSFVILLPLSDNKFQRCSAEPKRLADFIFLYISYTRSASALYR